MALRPSACMASETPAPLPPARSALQHLSPSLASPCIERPPLPFAAAAAPSPPRVIPATLWAVHWDAQTPRRLRNQGGHLPAVTPALETLVLAPLADQRSAAPPPALRPLPQPPRLIPDRLHRGGPDPPQRPLGPRTPSPLTGCNPLWGAPAGTSRTRAPASADTAPCSRGPSRRRSRSLCPLLS